MDQNIMKKKILLFLFLVIVQVVIGPPVNQKKKSDDDKNEENEINENEQLGSWGIEYDRYLKEVVQALEGDPEFREKLEKAEEVDIRTGKIAQELEYVSHNVRTKLDELKRQELDRLRRLATKEHDLMNGIDSEHLKIAPQHLDHSNPHTFEIEDLRKLIAKTTADLAEADKKRREEFKEYEMQKEFEKQEKLKNLDEDHKKQLQEELQAKEKKHKKHEPLHHPGSKQQLEEVWEKQDHMENQEFDPKTFFYLHDLDGNGVWDESEVKTLFLKELDKMYKQGAPEDDMRERIEEMERMREHVFSEADTNHDGLISYQEFLAQTQKPDFEKDQGWEGLDQQQLYTQEEYHEFERRRQEEVQRLIQQGMIPPYPNGMPPPPGYHPGVPVQQFQQPQHFPGQQHPAQGVQGQFHPGQGVPQGQLHQGMPQGQFHPGQGVPQGQFHPGQGVPQGQFQPGQGVPQGQFHPGQGVPQGQFHQGVPQGQFQQGVPQGQLHQGVPQGQLHQGVPQGQLHQGVPQGQLHPGQGVPQGQLHAAPAQPTQIQQGQVNQEPSDSAVVQQNAEQAQAIVQQHVNANQQQNDASHGDRNSLNIPIGHNPPQPIEHKSDPEVSKQSVDEKNQQAVHPSVKQ